MGSRKVIDCRSIPNDVGCTLAISGQEEEVLNAAVAHAVAVHGHANTPETREALRALLREESSQAGTGR